MKLKTEKNKHKFLPDVNVKNPVDYVYGLCLNYKHNIIISLILSLNRVLLWVGFKVVHINGCSLHGTVWPIYFLIIERTVLKIKNMQR